MIGQDKAVVAGRLLFILRCGCSSSDGGRINADSCVSLSEMVVCQLTKVMETLLKLLIRDRGVIDVVLSLDLCPHSRHQCGSGGS